MWIFLACSLFGWTFFGSFPAMKAGQKTQRSAQNIFERIRTKDESIFKNFFNFFNFSLFSEKLNFLQMIFDFFLEKTVFFSIIFSNGMLKKF